MKRGDKKILVTVKISYKAGLEMARSREKREIACAVFFKAPLFIFFVALFFEIARRARRNALRFPRFFLGPRDRNSFCAFSRFFPFDELVNGDIAALSPKKSPALALSRDFFPFLR